MTDFPADEAASDRLFVTALARGLDVLRAFQAGERSLGNQELAQRTRLPKSTVSRLTHTLCKLGYLVQDAHSGRYQLGAAVLTLGYAALANLDIRDRAQPLMRALSDATGLSVTLGALHGTRIVYVEACRAPTRVGIRLDVGSSVPLATTAIGRAAYSSLDEAARLRVERELALEHGAHWPRLRESLAEARRQWLEHGFCRSFGEFEGDIYAVGVALTIRPGETPLALNCSGPAYRLSEAQWAEEIAPRLIGLAAALSASR